MKNTLKQAAELIAGHARVRNLRIERVDVTLCEDGETIMFHAYTPDDECLTALADLPAQIDEGALLFREWRDAFMRLLPFNVLATREAA